MLKRLELNYFKKHEHLEVDFTAGLNGITGANYDGKSTILLGIMYCLGGSRMVPGKRLQTRGVNVGFRQRLWFEIPDKGDYLVARTKSSANLYRLTNADAALEDQEMVASGTSPVNTAIAELLGMPLRRFAQIKYAKQKAADAILKYGSGELFQIITELTGLGRITEVLELLGNDLKTQQAVVDLLPPEVDLAALRDQLGQQQTRSQSLQDEVAQCRAKLDGVDVAISSGDWKLAGLEELAGKLQKLQVAIERHRGEVAGLKVNESTERDAVQFATQHRDALLNGVEADVLRLSLTNEIVELGDQVQEARHAEQELAALTRALKDANDQVGLLRQRVATAAADMPAEPDHAQQGELAGDLEVLRSRCEAIRHDLKHATSAVQNGSCHACHRPFENHDPVAAKELQEKLQGELADAERARASADDELETCRRAATRWQKADSALALLRSELAGAEERAQQLAGKAAACPTKPGTADALALRAEEAKEQRRAIDTALSRCVEAESRYNATVKRLEEANRALDRATLDHTAALGNYPSDADAYAELESVRQALAEIRRERKEKADHLADLRETAANAAAEVQRLEAALAAGTEAAQRGAAARKRLVQLTSLRDLLRGNRDRYSRQVWDVFMASASLFATSVTGGAIESVSRDQEGAFSFVEQGFDMALEEASGAQQAIIGIAVQMALAEAAQCPLDILLMDEPTADMDAEHALAFSTLLAATGRQVVMVTHREMDAAVFDNAISLRGAA